MDNQVHMRIPVILDTDIGGDIDDTWALAMMLRCPELDVRLIVTTTGDTVYRAKIVARMLEIAGRTDIPVGIGLRQESDGAHERQRAWVEGYKLSAFPGRIYEDGVSALVDTIMGSAEPITLICIGPLTNIAAALAREPRIAEKANFVGMQGSIRRSHEGREGAVAEYNVVKDISACQRAFTAPWRGMTITPLDTCGQIWLDGERYQALRDSNDPLVQAVIENYRIWSGESPRFDPEKRSSILYDTVAIHLAFSTEFLRMERMRILISDSGFTVPDPAGQEVNVAIDWDDMEGFKDSLVRRLKG